MGEYKKYIDLYYCYNRDLDITVRIDLRDVGDVVTYNFKLSDWDNKDNFTYEELSKKEFKTAISATIKKLREVTK